jgi:hypothetical protein
MGVAIPVASHPMAQSVTRRGTDFRLIPRLETYPRVVAFAQTTPGKLVLLLAFGLGLLYGSEVWLPMFLCLTAITFFPIHRRALVTLATLFFTFVLPWEQFNESLYALGLYALVFAIGALVFWSAVRWPRSWFGRRPVLFFLGAFAALVVIVSVLHQDTWYYEFLWDLSFLLSTYIWFFAYALLDRNSADRDPFLLQMGTFRPFWGSTNTPFAKGAAYLRRVEARDADELAVTQIKGLKLLAWSILLSLLGKAIEYGVYHLGHIPTFPRALYLSVNRTPLPWYICWASLITSFSLGLVYLSVLGHQIIACCRMAGFRALRNTYRPLSSRTVAEFFNRYYFYFKELLVDFFFFPTFLRCFKNRKRLRMVAAIFAAACFGNAFFHFFRGLPFVRQFGLVGAVVNFQVYFFYCVLLATAICISDLRPRKPAPPGFLRGQLLPSVSVLFFFCVLEVFGSTGRNYPLVEHLRFLAHLFGVNP